MKLRIDTCGDCRFLRAVEGLEGPHAACHVLPPKTAWREADQRWLSVRPLVQSRDLACAKFDRFDVLKEPEEILHRRFMIAVAGAAFLLGFWLHMVLGVVTNA